VRASSNCSLESKSSAFSSSDPMLPPALRYLPQHGRYEHSLQVCVQGSGVGQEREPLQLAFPAPQIRFLTH